MSEYKYYREVGLGRYRSLIGALWFAKGWFQEKHLAALQAITEYAKIFKPDSYRSKVCADCRQDKPRSAMARKADKDGEKAVAKSGTVGKPVQHLSCKYCRKNKPWWWFAKLPVDALEQVAVQDRGGKAW